MNLWWKRMFNSNDLVKDNVSQALIIKRLEEQLEICNNIRERLLKESIDEIDALIQLRCENDGLKIRVEELESNQKEILLLEKEVCHWKSMALNFKKFHV